MSRTEGGRDASMRLADVLGVLSLATDLGVGSPLGNQLRVTIVSVRLGRTLGLDQEVMRELLYVALLRWIGCTSHAHELSTFFVDDIAAQQRGGLMDLGSPRDVMASIIRHAGEGWPPVRRLRTVARALSLGPRLGALFYRASCEVGVKLAQGLGLPEPVQRSLGAVFERWDGNGWPAGLSGPEIPLAARIVNVAQDAVTFEAAHGVEGAVEVLTGRSGHAHDPALISSFRKEAHGLMKGLEEQAWEHMLGSEPEPFLTVPAEGLDGVLRAVADFADLKDPFTVGHSPAVADLAAAAAGLALPTVDVDTVRRAGLLHDLGRVSVPNSIWEKPGRLSDSEWERVRMHPYFTERATVRCAALSPYGAVAAAHHERLDGSGYHRGSRAQQIGMPSRILAAADAYHAITEERAHRRAADPAAAKDLLREEVRTGRLDGQAVDAVLAAAGHRVRRTRRDWPAGLSTREVEVLRHAVKGASNRQIAERLYISERTVEHHLSHAYTKIGVFTRAAAALFAAQNDLLQD